MSRPDRQVLLDRINRKVSELRASEFSEEQLRWAVLVALHEGWPLRDAIVLREARRRAEMESNEAGAAWEKARGLARASVPVPTFELWIRPLRLVGEEDRLLVLTGPTQIHAWSRRRYTSLLSEAVRATDEFAGVRFSAVTLPIPMREAQAA